MCLCSIDDTGNYFFLFWIFTLQEEFVEIPIQIQECEQILYTKVTIYQWDEMDSVWIHTLFTTKKKYLI